MPIEHHAICNEAIEKEPYPCMVCWAVEQAYERGKADQRALNDMGDIRTWMGG